MPFGQLYEPLPAPILLCMYFTEVSWLCKEPPPHSLG